MSVHKFKFLEYLYKTRKSSLLFIVNLFLPLAVKFSCNEAKLKQNCEERFPPSFGLTSFWLELSSCMISMMVHTTVDWNVRILIQTNPILSIKPSHLENFTNFYNNFTNKSHMFQEGGWKGLYNFKKPTSPTLTNWLL